MLSKIRVLIKPTSPHNLNNQIFDDTIIKNRSVFARVREKCHRENIEIETIDKYDISDKPDCIFFFDLPYSWDLGNWKAILKNRVEYILFCFEPPIVNPFNYFKFLHKFFKKIYTWNDDLVDNKKYFKFHWPQSNFGMNTPKKLFQQKDFLVFINANKLAFLPFRLLSSFGKELYSERIKAVEYFEKKIPEKFSLYGRGWNKPKAYSVKERLFGFKKYKTYRGEIDNKIKLLSNFKYCLCFENLTNINGYFTEKIFDCFKAKCVPIYWGASNIEEYIPKNCFIDYRDFMSYEKLLNYLESIDENKYNQYIENIEKFLSNKDVLDTWFEDGWANFFLKVIKER